MKKPLQQATRAIVSPSANILGAASVDDFGSAKKIRPLRREKPDVFQEQTFIEYYQELADSGRDEQALTYLLESLPDLSRAKLNRKEKANLLIFLPRLVQAAANTKHGYQKVLRKARSVLEQVEGLDIPKDGVFVDFGCGAHDPVALSTFFYANGFSRALGIDMLPARVPLFAGLSMYDILSNMRIFPQRYCMPGVDPAEFVRRLRVFNLTAFERGDFERGIQSAKGHVEFAVSDISTSNLEKNSVSLLVSFAVFEHVMDMKSVCKKIYDVLKPGGVAYHFIDMADHRSYREDGQFGPLTFLTEENGPSNINRLRKHEQIAFQKEAGFEIVRQQSVSAKLTPELRSALVPRFKGMSDEDVSTVKLHLVLRKPASQV